MKSICILKSRMHKKGGLEKYVDRLASYLTQGRNQVLILTSSSDTPPSLSYGIKSLCTPSGNSLLHMLRFDHEARRYLKEHAADFQVVLGWDRHFVSLTHYRAGNGCHRAYLHHRGQSMDPFRKLLMWMRPLHWLTLYSEFRTICSPVTQIICNSDMVRKEFVKWYPKANPNNIHVIHNGVEWNEFEGPFANRSIERSVWCMGKGISPTVPHILFVGNEWGRKGLKELLIALSLMKQPFYCTAVGPEKKPEKYKKLVHSLHLDDKVELRPYHESMTSWYQRADILALPSIYDPFANVTVEALAMGLFVVTTSTNGGSEVLIDRKTGLVVPPKDPAQLRLALEEACSIVSTEQGIHDRIRSAAKPFDFSRTLQAYEKILNA